MHGTPRQVAGLLGLLLLTTTFGYSGPASGTQPEPDDPTPGAVLDRVGVDARGAGGVRRWPGKTITYRESLPKKWDESLRLALDAWNSAGGKLRFVKAKGGTKPQLTIGYGPTQGYAGFATIGPAKNAYVHLSTGYQNADADLEQRLGVGRLLAHELGHVVGFGHVGKGCELMVTSFPATCLLLSFEPGYRVCRWIDKPLLKKFIAAYGGKGKLAPKFCPIDPLPPQLEDVAFTGGAAAGQPVRVTWKAQPAKPGERVHIYVRAGACPSHPEGNSPDLEAFVSPTAGKLDRSQPGGRTRRALLHRARHQQVGRQPEALHPGCGSLCAAAGAAVGQQHRLGRRPGRVVVRRDLAGRDVTGGDPEAHRHAGLPDRDRRVHDVPARPAGSSWARTTAMSASRSSPRPTAGSGALASRTSSTCPRFTNHRHLSKGFTYADRRVNQPRRHDPWTRIANSTVPPAPPRSWRDKKRYLWLIGLVVPSLAFIGYGAAGR